MSINFRRLFFFGDSITDPGRLPEPFRPDPPYVGGRFTNGLVYAQILPRELGVCVHQLRLRRCEGRGVGTGAGPYRPRRPGHGLRDQVLLRRAERQRGRDLHRRQRPSRRRPERSDDRRPVLESIDDAAVRLARKGVDELILFNLPATSQTPRGIALPAAERAAEDAMVAAYNAGLRQLAATYNDAGVPTTIVDVDRLTREVARRPGAPSA